MIFAKFSIGCLCVCVCTQNCDMKQYLIPQLSGGITQPHVIQSMTIWTQSSHNHKQWTRQVSGSMMVSLLGPFYWVTNRCTDIAPVLGKGTDIIGSIPYLDTMYFRTLVLLVHQCSVIHNPYFRQNSPKCKTSVWALSLPIHHALYIKIYS